MADHRLVAVILEVSDLDSSVTLYRDAFGLDLQPGDNAVDDRWIGGSHAEISWRQGAYLHFALYPAKEQPTSGALISPSVDNIEAAHAAAVCAGARVLHEPRNEPWSRSGRYADFDGNVIELTSTHSWPGIAAHFAGWAGHGATKRDTAWRRLTA